MRRDQYVIEKRAGALYLVVLAVCGGQIGLHRCVRAYQIGTGVSHHRLENRDRLFRLSQQHGAVTAEALQPRRIPVIEEPAGMMWRLRQRGLGNVRVPLGLSDVTEERMILVSPGREPGS